MFRHVVTASKNALHDTVQHDGVEHAGYLAFLSLLSLFPFLVLMVALAGYVGASEVGQMFVQQVLSHQLVPVDVTNALKPQIDEIISGPPQDLLTLAVVGALWTASSMVEGMRTILNRAYRVAIPPAYIWRRLLSIVQCVVVMLVLLFLMMCVVVVPVLWFQVKHWLGLDVFELPIAIQGFATAIALVILYLVVALSYYFVPNVRQRLSDVAPGAVVVVILWYGAGWLLSEYLSKFQQVHVVYGSLGGIIAALLFFYVSGMIFIFGAELNYHLYVEGRDKGLGARD